MLAFEACLYCRVHPCTHHASQSGQWCRSHVISRLCTEAFTGEQAFCVKSVQCWVAAFSPRVIGVFWVATAWWIDRLLKRLWCWAVQVQPSAAGARNFSQCDSMLIGDTAGANTYPYITVRAFFLPPTFLAPRHGLTAHGVERQKHLQVKWLHHCRGCHWPLCYGQSPLQVLFSSQCACY